MCEECRQLAPRKALIELAPKVKRGTAGRYIHGYCYAVRYGLTAFKNLPNEGGLSQVTLSEFLALGLDMRVVDRSEKRGGVILTETHTRAAYCTKWVTDSGSVLSRGCYRKASLTSDEGKPICAWHATLEQRT